MGTFSLRHVFRSLLKNPLLSGVAVLSLGIGLGANTAIFSLIDQLLLRMLPVERPQELVGIASRGSNYGANWGMNALSYPMYRDFRDKMTSFAGVICRFATPLSMGYGGRTERIQGELVSGNYFTVLGVRPSFGRVFSAEDDTKPDSNPVAVISYDYWKNRFASNPAVVGQTIYVNSYPMTVVGVSAANFKGVEIGTATQVFVPMSMVNEMVPLLGSQAGEDGMLENRRWHWTEVFARLKPGVSRFAAQAEASTLYKQIIQMEVQQKAFAKASEYTRQRFLSSTIDIFDGSIGRSDLRRQFSTPLYVLMGITALVLLIACANVANLLLAQATARQKEIAVRLAIGASRRQIIGQLMAESLVLSVSASIVGIAFAAGIDAILLRFVPTDTSLTITANLDGRVLAFSFVIGIITAFLFGLGPALQAARPRIGETLKNETGAAAGIVSAHLRKALVVVQVGLSLLLLIASLLFVRSLSNLQKLDPGFRVDHLITFSIDPTLNAYSTDKTFAFYRGLKDRLLGLPGVESLGYSTMRLLAGDEWDSSIKVEGYHAEQGELINPHFNSVSSDYFSTLKTALLSGRDFTTRDAADAPQVCIVNESFVKKYFPDGLAVGRHIGMGGNPATPTDIEIVGVVRDAKYENMREVIPRQVFRPTEQVKPASGVVFYVRTAQDPAVFYGSVRQIVREQDSNLPVYEMRTLEQQVDRSLVAERMISVLSAAFGVVATILASIGLYGVMSFSVARRSREIGIRMALGAEPGKVLKMVLRDVGVLVAIGVTIALPAYFALAKFVDSQLYGLSPNDPSSIAGATLLILAVAFVAGFMPARRAASVDPIQVLRYE